MAINLGRPLFVGLRADTKSFGKSLSQAEKRMQMFKNTVKMAGTAIAGAFTAMGVAALAFGKTAVDAALEDQKGQRRLQKALENTTKATKKQRLAVEDSIDKYQMWYGVTDNKLRPAFQRLTQATKSITKTQKLMRLAMDISAGTGKDLESVANALAKAYGGNLASLQRLGLGLDAATIKSKDFDKVQGQLIKMFQGQGRAAAQSFQGQVDRLKIAWDEFQESVGYKILPKLGTMLRYIQNDLMPWLGKVKEGFQGTYKDNVTPKVRAMARAMGVDPEKPAAVSLGESLKRMSESFSNLLDSLNGKGPSGASTLDKLADALTKIADAVTAVNTAFSDAPNPTGFWSSGDFTIFGRNIDITPWDKGTGAQGPGFLQKRASGGPVNRNKPYLVGENGPEMFIPSGSGAIRTNRQTMAGGTTNIILNGIVDADSARRSIERVLQNSGKRLGAVNLTGSAL